MDSGLLHRCSSDYVAQRRAIGGGRGLFLAGTNDGEFGGDLPGGGEQDVARAAGDIGDTEIEQCGFRISRLERSAIR